MSSNDVKASHIHKGTQETNDQVEIDLNKIELLLKRRTEMLETSISLHQCEETSEEIPSPSGSPLLKITHRILLLLNRNSQAEYLIMKENNNLKEQLTRQQYLLEDVEMERDVLLQQVHAYLETNSSLRVRLEEQRCQTGALQRQVNMDLEAQIKSLEREKEQLIESNLEKDQKIHKMTLTLEQTVKSLKNREIEVLNHKNEENNLLSLMKADLKKALEEKTRTDEKYAILRERVENYFSERRFEESRLRIRRKRSLSVGDFSRLNLNFLEKNILLKPNSSFCSTQDLFKTLEHVEGNAWKPHLPRSCLNGLTTAVREERMRSAPVQIQLNSLRRDLFHVTKKLEALKFQLVNSGVIPEEAKPSKESRSLKRKANPLEEECGEVSEEQKSEFKNLKNILQDAKNLNAKLQYLREEKQRIIDSKETEGEVEVAEKENEFSQTAQEATSPTEIFKTR